MLTVVLSLTVKTLGQQLVWSTIVDPGKKQDLPNATSLSDVTKVVYFVLLCVKWQTHTRQAEWRHHWELFDRN